MVEDSLVAQNIRHD